MPKLWLGVGTALALVTLAASSGAAGVNAGSGLKGRATAAKAEYVPRELIVRFKPGVARTGRVTALQTTGASTKKPLRLPRAELVSLPAGTSVEAAAKKLERQPEVLYAEPNYIYRAAATPNDPRFGELWGLQQPSDHDIDAPEAWDQTTGSSAAKVAVVDTGVAYDHPDLAPNMLPGHDFYGNDNDPRDENGHGTHVAGTIGHGATTASASPGSTGTSA